ncbi:MAG TPA: hypothetical protein VHC46_09910 [Thermodesulfobacteriota bacterium]|nr:hypothetical protein [Thermodesulfobacteriota bacterium]
MRYIKVLFIILIILLFAILYTQNIDMFTHEFTLQLDLKKYIVGPYITKNVVIILAAFAAGAVVAVIFGALQSIGTGAESKEKSRRIRELEARNRELIEEKERTEKLKKTEPPSSPFGPPSAIDSSSQNS